MPGAHMGATPDMALFGLGMTAMVVGWLIGLIIAAWFMEMGAKLAGIKDVTLGKSFIAILGGGIIAAIVAMVLFFLPVINIIIAIVAYVWVIKTVFNTGWGKAFVALILAIILEIVVGVVIALLISALL